VAETVKHKVSALRQRTYSIAHGVDTKVAKDDFTEAVYIVNDYLRKDATLKALMGGEFQINPMVAEGPSPTKASVPYIRYIVLPATGQIWTIRTDVVRYYVGDKSFKLLGKILNRLQELLIVDDSKPPFPMKSDKFKIHSIEYLGGTNPTGPDQEEGVIERGLNIAIIYTVVS
jgi:hypothetical protein